MQIVDGETVHRRLDYPGLVEALRLAHRDEAPPEARAMLTGEPAGSAKFLCLLAWAPQDLIAVKLVGEFPQNTKRASPVASVQGIVALFSGATGAPVFACDGASLTFRKTAADSALGVDLLARRDAAVLLVVGAGGLAPHVIAAHTSQRPSLRRVLVWNRDPARAADLVRRLDMPGVEPTAVADLDRAVARADIISCVTGSRQPLVRGALLRPGTHVDLIGSYLPEMRESDDDVMRRGRVFVDTRNECTRSGDIGQPLANGTISVASIEADLYELCSGRRAGRRNDDEITVYKNNGGAHLDLYTARHLMRLFEERT
jgi:ornithine cyclodeaminase